MHLGRNIRWHRTRLHMTQAQLAALTRVNHHHPNASYISRVERGLLDPRWSTIKSIARALGVKPWVLVANRQDSTAFWEGYLRLSAAGKREVQRTIKWLLERGR